MMCNDSFIRLKVEVLRVARQMFMKHIWHKALLHFGLLWCAPCFDFVFTKCVFVASDFQVCQKRLREPIYGVEAVYFSRLYDPNVVRLNSQKARRKHGRKHGENYGIVLYSRHVRMK